MSSTRIKPYLNQFMPQSLWMGILMPKMSGLSLTLPFFLQIIIKSQNVKNHAFLCFEKNCLFLPTLSPFHRTFQKHQHIYIQFLCYLDFQKLKKDLENLFSSLYKGNFRKKTYCSHFCIIVQKNYIISDVIITIAANLEIFFYHFFCNIAKYDCAKFYVKSIFLSGFLQGGHYVPPTATPSPPPPPISPAWA